MWFTIVFDDRHMHCVQNLGSDALTLGYIMLGAFFLIGSGVVLYRFCKGQLSTNL